MYKTAIVSYFYGNNFSETYKTSLLSYKKYNPDIDIYVFGVNYVISDVYEFCIANCITFIELGFIADTRNHTMTRMKRFTSTITSLVNADFIIFTDLDICCTRTLPLDEMDYDKINICPDRMGTYDPIIWRNRTMYRFNDKYQLPIDMTYYNCGFIAFDKSIYSNDMDLLYETCCDDFYTCQVSDVMCYDQDYINLFTALNKNKIHELHSKWNYLIMTNTDYKELCDNTDVINIHFLNGNIKREDMIIAEYSGKRLEYNSPPNKPFHPMSRLQAARYYKQLNQ